LREVLKERLKMMGKRSPFISSSPHTLSIGWQSTSAKNPSGQCNVSNCQSNCTFEQVPETLIICNAFNTICQNVNHFLSDGCHSNSSECRQNEYVLRDKDERGTFRDLCARKCSWPSDERNTKTYFGWTWKGGDLVLNKIFENNFD
jgi:hypothetical protein